MSDNVDVVAFPVGLETVWEVFEVGTALDRLPDEERQVAR